MLAHDDISKGFVVPPAALKANLKGTELLFYSVIWTWTVKTGFCRTTSADLSHLFGFSKSSGAYVLSQMVREGLIEKVSVDGAPKAYAAKVLKIRR